MQTLTFAIPDDLARQFLKAVPAEERSEVAADALRKTLESRKMKERLDAELTAACDALNMDPAVAEVEREMDGLSGDGLSEYPLHASASR